MAPCFPRAFALGEYIGPLRGKESFLRRQFIVDCCKQRFEFRAEDFFGF